MATGLPPEAFETALAERADDALAAFAQAVARVWIGDEADTARVAVALIDLDTSDLLAATPSPTGFVVDGRVSLVANAADAEAVLAVAASPDGPLALVVPTRTTGVLVGPPVVALDGRETSIATDVCFDRVPVEADWRLPWHDNALHATRAWHAALLAAAADRYVTAARDYTRTRHAFGSPLAAHQAVRLRVAEVQTCVEGSRQLADAAVRSCAEQDGGGALLAAAADLKARRVVRVAAEACLSLHGARGYADGHPAGEFAADAVLYGLSRAAERKLLDTLEAVGRVDVRRKSPARKRAGEGVAALRPLLPALAGKPEVPVHEILTALAARSCLGLGFPPAVGGEGGDLWDAVALHEEVAGLGSSSIGTVVLSHLEVGTRLVADHATPAAVEQWVPGALRGEVVLGYAATEADAGSDLASTTTRARKASDEWVLDGAKRYITNGNIADGLCVLARTADRPITSHSLFLVPMRAPGVSTRPLASLGNQGTLSEVRFEDVRLDGDAVLGMEGQGLLLQIKRLAHERAFVAVMLAGLAEVVFQAVAPNAPPRRLAELRADVLEARQLAYFAVETLSSGRDARAPGAMAKLVAARVFKQAAECALDHLGDDGRQWYCDALGFGFAGGTENMLLEAIAR